MLRLVQIIVFIVVIGFALDRCEPLSELAYFSSDTERCDIKGNISFSTGERIYHVPGGEWYDETRINRSQGERWFCSEQEARQAGWRRAYE